MANCQKALINETVDIPSAAITDGRYNRKIAVFIDILFVFAFEY